MISVRNVTPNSAFDERWSMRLKSTRAGAIEPFIVNPDVSTVVDEDARRSGAPRRAGESELPC